VDRYSRRLIVSAAATFFLAAAFPARSGPVEFGNAELARAALASGAKPPNLSVSIRPGLPESWTLTPTAVIAADERGAMYALLEAADQIRDGHAIEPAGGKPAMPIRGVRVFLHSKDEEAGWYPLPEYWDAYFSMLARNRFNRFNLVFAHQTNYLAPPYPYLVKVPEYPQIRVPGLSDDERERNLRTLCYIARAAADHGVDFALGIWQQNNQSIQLGTTEGITAENIGPYSSAALASILRTCPEIRSVQVRTNSESAIPEDRQIPFFRDYLFPAIRDAGRTLDLRTWLQSDSMTNAARDVGVTTRTSTKYWAEFMGRPYQPPETYPAYGYQSLLAKPRAHPLFWEIWTLGSHRLLLWGSPEYARRMVATLTLSDTAGFEIDAPPTQKGYSNRPGHWDVFAESQGARKFWSWDFERYWFSYLLWGRLSYDPAASETLWRHELNRHFGAAGPEALEAYQQASRVLSEIVATHLADPNMYIWPEINPGGLIDSYKEVLPSDWRYVASIQEAVRNLRTGVPSAKQTPLDTAAILDDIAGRIDSALARATAKMPRDNREWSGSAPDFHVLAQLARYHAHKQRAAFALEWFDTTGNSAALAAARRDVTAGIAEWQELVRFTDGLYSHEFANGPDDVGHWKDKLPYVLHDLDLIREREEIFERFGRFDYGFDFGAAAAIPPPPPISTPGPAFRSTPYVRLNNVAARFTLVSPETAFDEKTGFGWVPKNFRRTTDIGAVPLTPYQEVRGVARAPFSLPHDVLFRDYIRSDNAKDFVIKAPPGNYEVIFLHPDRSVTTQKIDSSGDNLTIHFPSGDWVVSGLIVKGPQSRIPAPTMPQRVHLDAPRFTHRPPGFAVAGRALKLRLGVERGKYASIRLHYRALDQNQPFQMLEGGPEFTIPGEQVSARFDLIYYFEILNAQKSGWFYPDSAVATPYFVVETRLR
jgi:hypothetical protein